MKSFVLLLLRISVGLLIVWWGLDKIVDPAHGLAVSDRFYGGLLTWPALMPIFGGVQTLAGLLFMVGLFRRVVDPLVLLLNTASLLGVWRSIVDPWGWYMEGTNALFFPSLTVFAASLLFLAIHNEETLVLDRRRSGHPGAGRAA
jgi:putative oxidoreductase